MLNTPTENYVSTIRKKIGNDLLILVGSNVIIENELDQVLLQKRSSGTWGLPGGLLEVGETLEQTAIRLTIEELKLIHTFSGQDYHFVLQNKDEIYVVTSLYKAINYTGELNVSSEETLELSYFNYNSLPYNIEQEYLDYINYYRGLK